MDELYGMCIFSQKSCHERENFTVHPVFVIVILVLQNFIDDYIQKDARGCEWMFKSSLIHFSKGIRSSTSLPGLRTPGFDPSLDADRIPILGCGTGLLPAPPWAARRMNGDTI